MPIRFRRKRTETNPPPELNQQPQKNLERPSAQEIYKQVATNARQELKRTNTALGISGFGGGVFMGLSALGVSMAVSMLGNSPTAHLVSSMFYPLGFIVVIIGRAQLFTENTLYPVALVLAEKRQFWNTMRLWAVVLPSNVAGAFSFAMLAAWTSAFDSSTIDSLATLGLHATQHPATQVFWSGVIAGCVIALTAWMVSGSHSITGSVMIIWMLMFIVGLGNFAHCIASSCEIFVAILTHRTPWVSYPMWFFPAVMGNICGGVGLVTILEYGQVIYGGDAESQQGEEY